MSIPQDSCAEPTAVHCVHTSCPFPWGKVLEIAYRVHNPNTVWFHSAAPPKWSKPVTLQAILPKSPPLLMLPDCEQVCEMFSIMVLICFQPNPGIPSTGQSCFSRLKSITDFYLSLSVSYWCVGLSYPFWTLALCQLNALQASSPRCGLLVPFIIYAALDEF